MYFQLGQSFFRSHNKDLRLNLSHFAAYVSRLNQELKHCVCLVMQTFSIEETAGIIKSLCDQAADNSTVWSKEEWKKRGWLTGEISKVNF